MTRQEYTLREYQHWMKDQIHPMQAKSAEKSSSDILNPQGGVSGLERLEVYAKGYIARVHESLTESFEAVGHVLGHGMFVKLAEDYAAEYPSQNYNLSLLGSNLSSFLKTYDAVKELPFLPDLAEMEWKIAEAFHTFDRPVEGLEILSTLSGGDLEKIKIEFQPHVQIVKSEWPIWDIWHVRKEPVEKIKVDLINRPQQVLIYRNQWRVKCEAIDPVQFLLLEGLLKMENLGQVTDTLLEKHDELPETANYFSHWVQSGMIAHIYI